MSVQAVVLAAGEGMRLRPLTKNRPKVLLPAGNRPILEHVLDAVVAAGVRDITVVVGYKKEQVMKFLNTYPVPVKVVVQEKQLGTFHALSCAKDEVTADRLLIIPGDNYVTAASLKSLLQETNAALVAPHTRPWDYGVITQKEGTLCSTNMRAFDAPPGTLVETGTYLLERKLYSAFFALENPDDIVNEMSYTGHDVRVVEAKDWYDADCFADLLELNRYLLSKQTSCLGGSIDQRATIRGHVVIGKDVTVGPGTVITGPAILGDGCVIHPNVCIEPGTALGARVEVEPFTYLKNSIVMKDTRIGAQSRIVDSVIGEGCSLEQTSTASYSFGTVIGDRTNVGAFTRLKGAVIGNNVEIDGGKLIETEIPSDTRVM